MDCGSTGAALDGVAEWSMLTPEDEPGLAGVGTAARLDFFRGGSPPAAIATALAEVLRRRFERFGGILSLQKKSEKKNTRYYPKQYFDSENKTGPVMGKPKEAARKACQTKIRHSSFLLMPK